MSIYTESNVFVVTVPAGTPSRDWQRVANKRAQFAVLEAGLRWVDTEVLVQLPEAGRAFHKPAGALHLGAQG